MLPLLFFLSSSLSSLFLGPVLGEPRWQGSLGTAVIVAQVKLGDINYRRNVFTVKRLQLVLIATTASCDLETVGNGLRSVFDNAQEAKSSVNTERDRSRGVREYPDTAASVFSVDSGLLFSNAQLTATKM